MPAYTAQRTIDGDAEAYFDYVAEPTNLPKYFPRMSEAHLTGDGKVETTAQVDADQDGHDETVTSDVDFDVDRSSHTITWSAPGDHDYSGSIHLDDDRVELTIRTTSEFPGLQGSLDKALDAIARNLEELAG